MRKIFLIILILTLCFTSVTYATNEYWYDLLNITEYHKEGYTGQGVNIAVIDFGFVDLTQIKLSKIISFGEETYPFHGTVISSVVRDIAPDANIFALTQANILNIEQALRWCVDNDMDIVNMSIVMRDRMILRDINLADDILKSGMIINIAAGNARASHDSIIPSNPDGALFIGGTSYCNNVFKETPFVNQNWVDLVPPATNIKGLTIDGKLVEWSGTSIATGVASGMFAVLKSKYPNANKNELFKLITKDGIRVDGVHGIVPILPIDKVEPEPEPESEYPNLEDNHYEDLYYMYMKKPNINNYQRALNEIIKIKEYDVRINWYNKLLNN